MKRKGEGEDEASQQYREHVRAVASNRQTKALASVISFVFVVYRHHKQPKCT